MSSIAQDLIDAEPFTRHAPASDHKAFYDHIRSVVESVPRYFFEEDAKASAEKFTETFEIRRQTLENFKLPHDEFWIETRVLNKRIALYVRAEEGVLWLEILSKQYDGNAVDVGLLGAAHINLAERDNFYTRAVKLDGKEQTGESLRIAEKALFEGIWMLIGMCAFLCAPKAAMITEEFIDEKLQRSREKHGKTRLLSGTKRVRWNPYYMQHKSPHVAGGDTPTRSNRFHHVIAHWRNVGTPEEPRMTPVCAHTRGDITRGISVREVIVGDKAA